VLISGPPWSLFGLQLQLARASWDVWMLGVCGHGVLEWRGACTGTGVCQRLELLLVFMETRIAECGARRPKLWGDQKVTIPSHSKSWGEQGPAQGADTCSQSRSLSHGLCAAQMADGLCSGNRKSSRAPSSTKLILCFFLSPIPNR
jgi:hypothetical protein